jgi:hypothetical protein
MRTLADKRVGAAARKLPASSFTKLLHAFSLPKTRLQLFRLQFFTAVCYSRSTDQTQSSLFKPGVFPFLLGFFFAHFPS